MFHQHQLHGKYIPGNQFLVTEVLPMLFWNLWLPPLNQQLFLKIWQNTQIHLRQTLVIGVTQRKAKRRYDEQVNGLSVQVTVTQGGL